MSTVGLWLLSVGLGTLGASAARPLVEHLSLRGRARRLTARLPRTPIAEATENRLTKIVGRLELCDKELRAPLSGRACAYFEAGVEIGSGKRYRCVLSRNDATRFRIVDDSGQIEISPRGALIDVVIDQRWVASELEPEARFDKEAFLFQQGDLGSQLLTQRDKLRYFEGAFEPGELITVVGVIGAGQGHEPGVTYRDSKRALSLAGRLGTRLFLSDGAHYV